MNRMLKFILLVMFVVGTSPLLLAAEHGGKEHAGHEQADATQAQATSTEPSTEDVHQAIQNYITEESAETGTFDVLDEKTSDIRNLTFVRIHDRVGKTGDYYYSCADFQDKNSGELVDIDLDVDNSGGELSVVDVRIHKVNGSERYMYDENDNRIPVAATK